jgi:hypothetical protein
MDLVIALEGLVGDKGERGELAYRVSLLGAIIASDDAAIRDSTFKFLKNAYGLRSTVAHGENVKRTVTVNDEVLDIREFLVQLESIVREAIVRVVLHPELSKSTSRGGWIKEQVYKSAPRFVLADAGVTEAND